MKTILCLILFLNLSVWSLLGQVHFTRLNNEDGLSHSEVKSILQDSYGYIWVSTRNKLNRYDGCEFKVLDCYDSIANKRNNNTAALCEDMNRMLWVGTDEGVFIYDPVVETFTYLERWLNLQDAGFLYNWVSNIVADKEGNMWIVLPSCGIVKVNVQTKTYKLYSNFGHTVFEKGGPLSLTVDGQGIVWAGCIDQGICRYDKAKDDFIQVLEETGVFRGKGVYAMLSCKESLFIALHEGRLLRYNKETGMLALHDFPEVDNVMIRCLMMPKDEELWVGTNNGVYIYNLLTKSCTVFRNDSFDSHSLSCNTVTDMYIDKEKGIWVGTLYGGLNYQSRSAGNFMVYIPNDHSQSVQSQWIHGLYWDADMQKLWVGTEDEGCSVFDKKTLEFSRINARHTAPITYIRKINGNIWIGYFKNGLDIISPSMKITHYSSFELGLREESIYAFCEDHTGTIWISDGGGVYRAQKGTMRFERVTEFGNGYIQDIMEDSRGNIWIAAMGNGVYKYNIYSQESKQYLADGKSGSISSNSVSSILEDSKGRIWLSTDRGGICCFQNEVFYSYSLAEGLPDDIVYRAVEDVYGNIWFGTNHGLVRLEPDSKKVQVFDTKDGLSVSRFNYNSVALTDGGTIFMGTMHGLVSFNPGQFVRNDLVPSVYFTDFQVNGKNLLPNVINQYEKDYKITLKYDERNISIRFIALSFASPGANRYAYRMSNVDNGWIYTDKNVISYAGLTTGKYVLHVKGANNMGVWDETEKMLIIDVLPPWWASPVAYIIYILMVLSLLFYWVRTYLKRVARRNEEKNLIYTIEKEKELYESKVAFFTNITHEIRTPLTLINGPLDLVIQESALFPKNVQRYLGLIKQNVDQLLNLVSQLLDFKAAENMNKPLIFSEIKALHLIESLKERFSVLLSERNKTFEVMANQVDPDICVIADKDAVDKIMNNLIFNAIKYSNMRITVRVSRDEEFLILEIINDGLLVSKDMHEAIFEPFVRAENSKENIGVGIGLSLCRSLVEQHRGTLTYREMEGLNCFILKLPVRQKITESVQAVEMSNGQIQLNRNNVRVTLLIVDDHPDVVDFLSEQLYEEYTILTASDGVQALNIIEHNKVDIVLSDIIMPNMDGLSLCRNLKSEVNTSHILVVLLTSKNDVSTKIQGLEAGADAYVEKPFNLNYLSALLKSLITNKNRDISLQNSKPLVPIGLVEINKADENFVNQVVDIVNANISDPAFNVEVLTTKMCMSHSNFSKRLKGIVNMSPIEFIRFVRLNRAATILSQEDCQVNEVSVLVGINSTSNFIQQFQKQFGKTPNEFRKECKRKEIEPEK
ncbi:hybrid sensor histidine kinase/response regulator transcription factor [Bacteroides sp.]|uniref:hybrid sensor histidine kinase/response regulator transcription factor n=1 Tax=Bacteroides sp. TaxID=29523 RepID=UPI0025C3F2F1|nr:hybrid sensor histidine kinase/response regulator transcription factor [Bacteroides sp.]